MNGYLIAFNFNLGQSPAPETVRKLLGQLKASRIVYHQVLVVHRLASPLERRRRENFRTDSAVTDMDDPVHKFRDPRIVGHYNDSNTDSTVQTSKQLQNLVRSRGVKFPGGFVSQ